MSLSKAQIIHLSSLARSAFDSLTEKHGQSFTDWRHDELDRVLGVRSFNHCRAEDYETLREHFHRMRMVHLQDAAIAAM